MKKGVMFVLLVAVLLSFGLATDVVADDKRPTISKPCDNCHKAEANVLRGTLGVLSLKAETVQLNTGAVWVVKFDDKTKVEGWGQPLNKLPRGKEIAVFITKKDNDLYATKISVKQPAKLPPEKIITTEQVAEHIEKGDALIVDSRPPARFYEGALPTAINIYDAEFDKHIDKLPKDKNKLIIFYCQGPTCRLSPASATKAEKLGYKNVKVYVDGFPAWKKAGKLSIVCSPCLRERIKRDIPTIIVDLRSPGEAKKGHIPSAVSIPITELTHAIDRFPKDKRAPMVLYSYDTKSAIQAYEIISIWGNYTNIGVLDGGFEQWLKDGGQVAKGDMPTKIVYEPKPRPGEMGVDEFKKIAEAKPADVFILDVRDSDEAEAGMLVGAKNIPTQEIKAKAAEIPKDKTIVIHCSTGARADIAHSILTNELGYKNVKFLNANIKIDPNGRYEITKD